MITPKFNLKSVMQSAGPYVRVLHHMLIALEHLNGTSAYNTGAIQNLRHVVKPAARIADGLLNGFNNLPDEYTGQEQNAPLFPKQTPNVIKKDPLAISEIIKNIRHAD